MIRPCPSFPPLPRLLVRAPLPLVVLFALLAPWAGAQTPATAPTNAAWEAVDTQKHAVAVPADKPTLLVFLRPDQAQSQEEIKILLQMLTGRKELQVIAIVSGDDASVAAGKLTTAGQWTWHVVADKDYAASGKFSVQVWPSTLVLGKKGEPVGRIAGLPANLENDLPAYLDFSAGKIDKETLDKRLADREVVKDTTDQKAARHVEVAQRLAAKGMTDDARKELASANTLAPKDPNIQMAIARTDLMIGDAAAADRLLAALVDPAVNASELHLLQGWCAVELGKWDDARKILTEGAKLNPDPGETLYLLGRVYEHDGDAKQAADCYRKAFEHTAAGKAMGRG